MNVFMCSEKNCLAEEKASKMHILKNRVHSRSLEELHNKYVLVPADKAAQYVIIVCKKYYLEVEIDTTITYEHVMEECQGIVDRHIKNI